MYKLLLVTDKQPVLEAHSAIQSWEELGFRQPAKAHSAAEALEALSTRRMDAIAVALSPGEQEKLLQQLIQSFPLLPLIDAESETGECLARLRELEDLLNTLTGDFSDDGFNRHDMMQYLRHDYFRRLLGGAVRSETELRRRLKLLRSRMDPDRPCAIVDMAIPENADFLVNRWHYGNERLETALRNFFGAELDGMRILISVLADGRIRMLCCPMWGETVKADSITNEVYDHTIANIAHVREYLDVDLRITGMTVLNRLVDLTLNQ